MDANAGSTEGPAMEVARADTLTLSTLHAYASPAETAILDKWTDGVALFDTEGRYTYINDAGESLACVPRATLIGNVFWEVFPEVIGNPVHRAIVSIASGGPAETLAPFYHAPWDRWFEAEMFPIHGGVCGLWRDVTEHERARRGDD
jgi:PAS domain-containing protein